MTGQLRLMLTFFIFLLPGEVLRSGSPDSSQTLTLEQCIRLALEHNLQIRISQQGIYGAEAKVTESKNTLYPSVTSSASYSHLGPVSSYSFQMSPAAPPITMKFGLEDSYNLGINVQQQVFNWGRNQTAVEINETGVRLSETARDMTRMIVAYQVIQLFYGILMSREGERVLDQNIVSLQSRRDATQKRYESGISSRFEILTLDVQIASIRSRKIDMEGNIRRMSILLNRMMGLPITGELAVAGSMNYDPVTVGIDSLAGRAFATRYEIAQGKLQEELLRKQIEMTRTFDKPTLSLSLNWGLRNGFYPNMDVLPGNWNAAVTVAYPIFDGFRTGSQVAQAEVNLRSAQLRNDDLQSSIITELQQAVIDMEIIKEKISIEELKIQQADEALKIAEERSNQGLLSIQDLLDAQTTAETARLNRLQAVYNYIISTYAVDKASGKLPY